jgi:pseudouridine-5'-phosphate glycosidase
MTVVPELGPAVRAAIESGRPVVALESTIISHGLPRPGNLPAARSFEEMLTDAGVVPATIAVIDGVPKVGLSDTELERIALDESVVKVSTRDLGLAMVAKRTAGTTVAATSALAALAGIRVFATGGLGGVHRGFAESPDESADLTVLSRTSITVVSAGVKSILDIPATLERLETLGIAVVGYRTDRFPAFYLTDSGQPLDWRLDSAQEIAAVMAARDALGDQSALLVANPLPEDKQLDKTLHDRVLAEALAAAEQTGVRGKAVTPYLLAYMQRATGGASVAVNLDVAYGNIAVAGQIATAWAARSTLNR